MRGAAFVLLVLVAITAIRVLVRKARRRGGVDYPIAEDNATADGPRGMSIPRRPFSADRRSSAPARARRNYEPGQIWSYKTRPTETASRLTIVKVEPYEDGLAVHVHISGLLIRNPAAPSGVSTFIAHMPFAREAIDASVVRLMSKRQRLPSYEEGYVAWKQQAERGKAGVFTIPVAEAIEGIERAFSSPQRASTPSTN